MLKLNGRQVSYFTGSLAFVLLISFLDKEYYIYSLSFCEKREEQDRIFICKKGFKGE
jgi:hypothetical protein